MLKDWGGEGIFRGAAFFDADRLLTPDGQCKVCAVLIRRGNILLLRLHIKLERTASFDAAWLS